MIMKRTGRNVRICLIVLIALYLIISGYVELVVAAVWLAIMLTFIIRMDK